MLFGVVSFTAQFLRSLYVVFLIIFSVLPDPRCLLSLSWTCRGSIGVEGREATMVQRGTKNDVAFWLYVTRQSSTMVGFPFLPKPFRPTPTDEPSCQSLSLVPRDPSFTLKGLFSVI